MNIPIAPIAGAALGIVAAAGIAVIPTDLLETLVMDSGLPAVLAMAEPPLGVTARIALALGTGGFVAAFTWFGLFVLIGTRGLVAERSATATDIEPLAPILRRADAHPDAPPRPPLLATRDLGTPFLEIRAEEKPRPVTPPVEQPLPQDLDQPLAAFDPGALLDEPLPAPAPLPPLRHPPLDHAPIDHAPPSQPARPPVFAEHERFEVFELPKPVRPVPAPPAPTAAGRNEASVHALLERLEKGVVGRGIVTRPAPAPREAERGLEEALVTLRNLARRA